MRGFKSITILLACLIVFFLTSNVSAITPKSNVLILFSNDWTATLPGHSFSSSYDNSLDYYGYFDSNKEYSYQTNKYFVPVGYTQNHYTTNTDHWSGNFLNWVTMTHADLIRKTFTGGKRSIDANKKTVLVRAEIAEHTTFKKSHIDGDLNRLVPAAYADPTVFFYNTGITMSILDQQGRELSPEFAIRISVCETSWPEENCTFYANSSDMKPEGIVQQYNEHMNFGLMSHTVAQMTEGGVLRVPLGPVDGEFSQNSGQLASGEGVINIINDINLERGWSPTAEMYYEALRYLKGNESGQSAYCGASELSAEDGFNVHGCAPNRLWVDPISDPCQKTSIIIVSDEYPSKDSNMLPGSSFHPGYFDAPMNFGVNTPYNPDTSELTNVVGNVEGITGSRQVVGNVIGTEDNTCTQKTVFNLSDANGVCPSEPQAEGSFYTAGLAYNAFIGDLRPNLVGRQNVETYVMTYRASPSAYQEPQPPMNPLWLTTKYGNFIDRNKNNTPDDNEWMKNSVTCDPFDSNDTDCQPRGFFYIDQGIGIEYAVIETLWRDIGEDGICDNVGDNDSDEIVDQDDICPFDPLNDIDNDGICGDIDNCPSINNVGQEDANSDGIGDACTQLLP